MDENLNNVILNNNSGHELERLVNGRLVVLEKGTGATVDEFTERELLGATVVKDGLQLTFYRKNKGFNFLCCGSSVQKRLGNFTARLSQESAKHWQGLINESSEGESGDVLVIINPASGTKRGLVVFNNEVSPVLKAAGIMASVLVTSRQNEATEYVRDHGELRRFRAILCVGGDGTLAEVLRGIWQRPDKSYFLVNLALMPIPAGTGNGLSKSITHEAGESCTATACTYLAIKGKPQSMDLVEVQSEAQKGDLHSFLLLGWGLIADVDILSESMRYLGELRLHIAAAYFIYRQQLYAGKLTIVPHLEGTGPPAETVSLPDFDSPFKLAGCPPSEVVSNGPFCLVWVVQTSHCTQTIYSGPECKIGSGFFTVYWVENMGRCEMLSLLLTIDDGGHANNPAVKSRKAVAYRIEPTQAEASDKKGFYTLDGEVLPSGKVQGIVRAAQCFTRK
jgi:sphingosine kinase